MKAVIMPGFSELIIIANPTRKVTREGLHFIIMPWLYAPWPDAKRTGIIQIEVAGETIRELLSELSQKYKQANVDFEPIDLQSNDLDFDYEVIVNNQNYFSLDQGLDTKLLNNDEVIVKMLWRWDG